MQRSNGLRTQSHGTRIDGVRYFHACHSPNIHSAGRTLFTYKHSAAAYQLHTSLRPAWPKCWKQEHCPTGHYPNVSNIPSGPHKHVLECPPPTRVPVDTPPVFAVKGRGRSRASNHGVPFTRSRSGRVRDHIPKRRDRDKPHSPVGVAPGCEETHQR